jgi:hypothetical protein
MDASNIMTAALVTTTFIECALVRTTRRDYQLPVRSLRSGIVDYTERPR